MSKFLYSLKEKQLGRRLHLVKDAFINFLSAMSGESYHFSDPSVIQALPHLSEMLFSFSKFKAGDQVMLKNLPKIKKESGWFGSKHYVVPGNSAVVNDVCLDVEEKDEGIDFYFVYSIRFDNQTYLSTYNLDSNEEISFKSIEQPYSFPFREDKLEIYTDNIWDFFRFELEERSKKYLITTKVVHGKFNVEAEKIEKEKKA